MQEQRKVMPGLLRISREIGIPPVATNDAHYLTRRDSEAQDVFLCIGRAQRGVLAVGEHAEPNRLGYSLVVPTVLREKGFEFRIFTSDHRPPHVHAFKAEAEILINLIPLSVREAACASEREIATALEIATTHHGRLMARWEEIHGK